MYQATVSTDDIARLAKLAALTVSLEDENKYAYQIAELLAYFQRLQAVDVSSIEDGAVFSEALPPDRDLVRTDGEIRERIIQEFPDRLGDLLRVPGVFAHRKP